MIELQAGKLIESFGCLMTFCQVIKDDRHFGRPSIIDKNSWSHLQTSALAVKEDAERINLPVSRKSADRVLRYLGDCPHEPRQLDAQAIAMLINAIDGVSNGLQGELQDELCFIIPARMSKLYASTDPPFGVEVDTKFPSLAADIDEAGKCLALERWTASAFHYIRCLEGGLKALARCLGIPDPTKGAERNWSLIMKKIDDEMKTRWPSAADQMQPDYKTFDKIRAALRTFQNPYRNETMHLEATYAEDEAGHIREMVRGLMKQIAARCDEQGRPKLP
jgi:hypothetical protein